MRTLIVFACRQTVGEPTTDRPVSTSGEVIDDDRRDS